MIFFLSLCFAGMTAYSQVDTTTAPYQRYPTVPPFNILLQDSSSHFAKGDLPQKKPVWFILFSPDCSHCQHETEELIAHKDELKDISIVMVTMHPMDAMRHFISRYRLDSLSNVVVGRDYLYLMPGFFNFRNLPFQAFYDKKGKLLGTFDGTIEIEKVLEFLK